MKDKHLASELSRDLSLFHITMMGIGMMIGAGVFLGIGNAIGLAGPGGVVLTFALNGVLAIMTAMSYAELSSAIPKAGGAYNFARIAFGRKTSFMAGWMEWFASSIAGSLYAITFALYVMRYLQLIGLLPDLGNYDFISKKAVAAIIAIFFIYINYRGASETGKTGALFTLGQTIFLIIIGVYGLYIIIKDPARLQNFKPFLPMGWSKLFLTMGFTYVAFEGFEVIAQTGDEAIDPKRNLPKAMIYSVFIVTITYILVSFSAVIAVKAGSPGIDMAPWKWIGKAGDKGFGEAISRLMPMGNMLLTIAVIFASTSALNATIYSATRACYALGRDNMIPTYYSKISKKRKTPYTALMATAVLVLIVATLLPTKHVASSASMMFLFLFFLVNICVIKIRYNMGDELKYGFLMPLFPLFPVIGIVAQIILALGLIHMSWIAWIVGPTWVLSGIIIYQVYSRKHIKISQDEIFIFEEEKAPKKYGYKIMVSVANPDNTLNLVRTAYRIYKVKKADVELLHMVPVPSQVPLEDAKKYMGEGKEAMVEAMLYLAPIFPVSTTLRYCRNIARGIVNAVKQKNVDLLIIGWHGSSKSKEFKLGSTIDTILERSPCNVAILKDVGHREFKNILVPIAGGPNSSFALELASMIAKKDKGQLTAFTVHSDKNKLDLTKFIYDNRNKLALPPEEIRQIVLFSNKIVNTILEESEQYDLVVLGKTHEPLLYQFIKHSIPEIIAEKCQKPVIMVKASSGIRSWIKKWI